LLLHALGSWRRRLPLAARLRLTSPATAPPVAAALALRRLAELTHLPTAGARRLYAEVVAWLDAHGDDNPDPDPVALAAGASGLLALATQPGAEPMLRDAAAFYAARAIDLLAACMPDAMPLRPRRSTSFALPSGPPPVASRSAPIGGRSAFCDDALDDGDAALIAWLLAAAPGHAGRVSSSSTGGAATSASQPSPVLHHAAREAERLVNALLSRLDDAGARFDRQLRALIAAAEGTVGRSHPHSPRIASIASDPTGEVSTLDERARSLAAAPHSTSIVHHDLSPSSARTAAA
jgi:hypothetical protein